MGQRIGVIISIDRKRQHKQRDPAFFYPSRHSALKPQFENKSIRITLIELNVMCKAMGASKEERFS